MNAPARSPDAFRLPDGRALSVFLIAGEPSGDALGADLMRALTKRAGAMRFAGVGGPAMEAQGLKSLLPLSEIAVMGILPVLRRLPYLIASIRMVARAVIAARPDVLVIIDSPDFTHRVARRVRGARPDLPIVNYVGPSVWAWRPGRARRMRAYLDHVLALLPFEPAAYARLGGPACTYVSHPLVGQIAALRPSAEDLRLQDAMSPTVLVMPGSREAEIRRLMPVFGSAVALLSETARLDVLLPTLPHLEPLVRSEAQKWLIKPRIVTDTREKFAAMKRGRAALIASGTATLELALAGVPMVVAYRVSLIEEIVARLMIKVPDLALPNLILGRTIVPEFLQRNCTPTRLVAGLRPLLYGGVERDAQLAAFRELDSLMKADRQGSPGQMAADIIGRIAHRPSG
ncbi:MAG: lipid-A-disaccharide synthase [Methylobacteriaceae bacterium]|nr:lipid-A-disaccharide synthase [Methylobacteriaceae bacterium]